MISVHAQRSYFRIYPCITFVLAVMLIFSYPASVPADDDWAWQNPLMSPNPGNNIHNDSCETTSDNLCPDGLNGGVDGCTDTQWSHPLTPIDKASPPWTKTKSSALPGECTGGAGDRHRDPQSGHYRPADPAAQGALFSAWQTTFNAMQEYYPVISATCTANLINTEGWGACIAPAIKTDTCGPLATCDPSDPRSPIGTAGIATPTQ